MMSRRTADALLFWRQITWLGLPQTPRGFAAQLLSIFALIPMLIRHRAMGGAWWSLQAGSPRRRFSCRPRTLCSSDFDEWLAANQLPGYRSFGSAASGSSAVTAAATDTAQQLSALRFHASEAPAIASAWYKQYGMEWHLEAPGTLVANGGSSSGGNAKLLLPRCLEGAHPALFAAHQPRDASPLPISAEEEQQRLLHALRCLAAPQPSPTAGHNSLLVLLSADSAALAMYSGEGQLQRHRVLTGYTVRRQQGKAQATYERQGGGEWCIGGSVGRPGGTLCGRLGLAGL